MGENLVFLQSSPAQGRRAAGQRLRGKGAKPVFGVDTILVVGLRGSPFLVVILRPVGRRRRSPGGDDELRNRDR